MKFEPALLYLGHVGCVTPNKHRWVSATLFSGGISYNKEMFTDVMQHAPRK